MDDFGSIIYIVFTIIAIVFSIIKKSNQKNKPTTPSAPMDNNDPFEDVIPTFEKMFGEEKQSQNPEPVIISEPIAKKATSSTLEEKKKEMESKFSRIQQKPKSPQKDHVEEVSDTDKNWFNLRQAVIYSEILKRPNL